jgi:hypothetical protein
MDKTDDGGPAFPAQDANNWYIGMSLRDYFAAKALEGMHARDTYDPGQSTPEQRAHLCYIDADAMLRERVK